MILWDNTRSKFLECYPMSILVYTKLDQKIKFKAKNFVSRVLRFNFIVDL